MKKTGKDEQQPALGELDRISHFLSGCSGLFFDQPVQKSFDRARCLIEKESDMLKKVWEIPGAVILHPNILIPAGTIVFRDYLKKYPFDRTEFKMYVSSETREDLGIGNQVSLSEPLVVTEYKGENAKLSDMGHVSTEGWVRNLSPEEALYILLYLWTLNHESFFYFYRTAQVVFHAPKVRGGTYGTWHLDYMRGQGADGKAFVSFSASKLDGAMQIYKDLFFLANAKNQIVEHRAIQAMLSRV